MSCNIQVVTLQIAQTNLEFWELDGLLQKPEVRSSLMTLYYRREEHGWIFFPILKSLSFQSSGQKFSQKVVDSGFHQPRQPYLSQGHPRRLTKNIHP